MIDDFDRDENPTKELCVWCGKKVGVIYTPDPFSEELYDDHTEDWWCDECYQIRLDDI